MRFGFSARGIAGQIGEDALRSNDPSELNLRFEISNVGRATALDGSCCSRFPRESLARIIQGERPA
jgi:hypothetical protein